MNKEQVMAIVRRFVRVFIVSFALAFCTFMELFTGWEVIRDGFMVGVDIGLKAFWGSALYPAVFAGMSAGVNALGKALREYLRSKELESWASKIFF